MADSTGADLTTTTNYLTAVASNPADFRGDDTYWTRQGYWPRGPHREIADQLN